MIHKLKIKDNYLERLLDGTKRAEVRLNDRDYQLGDILEFKSYPLLDKVLTHQFKITHMHSGLGLEFNYVVLSVDIIDKLKEKK